VTVKVTNGVVAHVPSEDIRLREDAPAKPKQDMSATVQRLAKRLGVPADELAKTIPADTLRRTKFPVTEQDNEDGTTSFTHPTQVIVAPRSSASN
jgi:hypothetical protein